MSRPIAESDPFRAVADPTRRRLLLLLRKGPAPPGELLQQFRMSWPSLSHHLRILRGAGLLTQKRVGRGRIYALNERRLRAISVFLAEFHPPSTARPRRTKAGAVAG